LQLAFGCAAVVSAALFKRLCFAGVRFQPRLKDYDFGWRSASALR
jgi:hypothetical protein